MAGSWRGSTTGHVVKATLVSVDAEVQNNHQLLTLKVHFADNTLTEVKHFNAGPLLDFYIYLLGVLLLLLK